MGSWGQLGAATNMLKPGPIFLALYGQVSDDGVQAFPFKEWQMFMMFTNYYYAFLAILSGGISTYNSGLGLGV